MVLNLARRAAAPVRLLRRAAADRSGSLVRNVVLLALALIAFVA